VDVSERLLLGQHVNSLGIGVGVNLKTRR